MRLAGGRAEKRLDEVLHELPYDVLVLDKRKFDPSRILLPRADGHSSDLIAEAARALQGRVGANVAVLHVADDATTGREFLEEWAVEHRLDEAELLVEIGDIETAIGNAATGRTLVIVGATEHGLPSRIIGGSLTLFILGTLGTAALLVERPHARSIRERLFG